LDLLRGSLLGTVVAVALPWSSAAGAEEQPASVRDPLGTFTFVFENDVFTPENTDGHYTNGLRFSYLTEEGRVWNWVKSAARAVPFFPKGGRLRASYALGQSLYTPEDISKTGLIPDDRPYAGWLYGAVGLVADNRRVLDVIEFSVGVVGPLALGEEMQKFIHTIIDSPEPMGWDNQIGNELALQLTYERNWRNLTSLGNTALEVEATPHAGAALGNVFIYGSGGAMARIGNDLRSDYGPPRIRPSMPGSDFFVPGKKIGWYLFLGAEGRAVARNIFLDGNTFKDSHSVDKNVLVGDIQAGAALTLRRIRLAFTYVFRSEEFVGQRRPDQFAALTFSVRL
jgi:lipid A 3-O-deacylase